MFDESRDYCLSPFPPSTRVPTPHPQFDSNREKEKMSPNQGGIEEFRPPQVQHMVAAQICKKIYIFHGTVFFAKRCNLWFFQRSTTTLLNCPI